MTNRRLTFILAAAVFAIVMAVYGSMLPAGVGVGDEAEAETVPYILGISHPTGFPAYTLAGWAFSHALLVSTVAWRLNAFNAVCTALSVTGVFLLSETLAGDAVAAALATGTFAFGATTWNSALHANAQVLALTCGVFALWACVLFVRSGDRRALVAACACCGLGIATHPFAIWIAPAIVVALLWQRKAITRPSAGVAVAAFAIPLLLYAYFPLRSTFIAARGLDPAAAAPLYAAGSIDWDTNSPRTLDGFLDEVFARKQSAAYSLIHTFNPRIIPAAALLWFNLANKQYRIWLLLLAALGTVALARHNIRALSVLLAGALGGMLFLQVYRSDAHLDRYVLVSLAVVAALATTSVRLPRARVVASLALAALAGLALAQNRPLLPESVGQYGESIIAAVRQGTPDGSIVIASWDNAAALGYGAFVEHALGSRIIIYAWLGIHGGAYERWGAARPLPFPASPFEMHQIWYMPLRPAASR